MVYPNRRYEIVEGHTPGDWPTRPPTDWWTVVEYDGDTCKGGDAHWVCRELAEAAQSLYEDESTLHGKALPQDVVQRAKNRGWNPLVHRCWARA